jgi:DNA-binding NarL/FixJ family response regulator
MERIAIDPDRPPSPRPTSDREDGGKAPGAARPARLLIVEDDYFVALELEHQLAAAGFAVIGVAATAEEAIDLAQAGKPDLAIMDIRLAGSRDGIEAAADLKARYGIRSIFASAHSDPETRLRGEKAEPLGWLPKPYASDTLIGMINRFLRTPR